MAHVIVKHIRQDRLSLVQRIRGSYTLVKPLLRSYFCVTESRHLLLKVVWRSLGVGVVVHRSKP